MDTATATAILTTPHRVTTRVGPDRFNVGTLLGFFVVIDAATVRTGAGIVGAHVDAQDAVWDALMRN